MLEIKNVSKEYSGGKYANQNISLNIEDGQIFGFIGPNGAGKSTLIKSIVGLHKYDSGNITLDGISILDNELLFKSKIAYIPDDPLVYESMTGIGYLNFISDVFNISKEERKVRIEEYAKKFQLLDDLANQIKSYSHGMKQKLMLISAFIHNPKLLVLDEPFVGLDPKSSYNLKEMMREFVNDGNIIFFSSHVLEVVEKLCDQIAIINGGKVIYSGDIKDLAIDKSLEEVFLEKTL